MKKPGAIIKAALGLGICTAFVACGDDELPTDQTLALRFEAQVGSEPFECGRVYSDLGTPSMSVSFSDLRFYVHNVHLIRSDGTSVPVALTQDGKWQRGDLALLDFEDKSATCENGTVDLRSEVEGTIPSGSYEGLGFTLGVPYEMNHGNAAVEGSPLNLTPLFWNWNAGYKYVRVDGQTMSTDTATATVRLHLGSTACEGDMAGNVQSCANPNRVEVSFESFNPETDAVVLDLAEIFRRADISVNTQDTPPGCMSSPDDPDCVGVFEALGLPFGTAPGGTQTIFRSETASIDLQQ